MSLEEALNKNTAALEAHTAALMSNREFVEKVAASQQGKAPAAKETAATNTAAKPKTAAKGKAAAKATTISDADLKATAMAFVKLDDDTAGIDARRKILTGYAKKTHDLGKFTEIPEDGREAALQFVAEETEKYLDGADDADEAADDEDDL